MKKTLYNLLSVLVTLVMTLGMVHTANASDENRPAQAGIIYFVSSSGNDTNNCVQQTTPCKTFDKAMSLAQTGDIIRIIGTISSIRITKSGITVEGGVVDGMENKKKDSPALGIAANNVTIRDIEVINGWAYGIRTDAGYSDITLENVTIHNNVLENKLTTGGCNTSNTSGWGSGFRAYYASNVVMRNSKIYDNCGEGFSSVMSSNVMGVNLNVYDNFSVNIYPDQSQNFTITDSIITCTKPEYQRFGLSVSLLLGAEDYSGVSTNTTDGVIFERNKIYNCKGVKTYSETTNLWNNIRVVNNEFYNVPASAIGVILGTNIVTSPNVISSNPATSTPTAMPVYTNTPTPTTQPSATPTIITPSPTPLPTHTPETTATSVRPTEERTEETPPSPAEVIYDNKDTNFVYSPEWDDIRNKKAYGKSYMETSSNGASLTLPFTGQSFSILYTGGPTLRNMDVYVDNVLVGSINQRMDAKSFQTRWDYTGQLEPGSHTLKLVFVTNKAGKTKGTVDAVIVR